MAVIGNDKPCKVFREHMTQITPASWVFSVWLILSGIFIVWFLYVFYLLICRQSCSRDNKSPLFSGIFWFLFIMVNVLNAISSHLFINDHILISGIILLILVITLYVLSSLAARVALFDAVCKNNDSNDDNVELSVCEIALLRMLTLNVFPLYAMWCTLMACLHWAIIFKYHLFHFSDNVSCVLALGILSVILVIHWAFELLFKRKYYVWTWLPSFALVVFFTAIIMKHRSVGGLHTPGLFFAFILLIVAGIAIIIKSCGICLCYPKTPSPRFSRI